jgi:outer membrane murein-binding lipoprotein Lpp
MRIRNLAVTATLIPVLMLAGCGNDESTDVAASSPGAKKAAKHDLADAVAADRSNQAGSPQSSDDPVVNAYYSYRVALDVMMRSGGRATKQLVPVMTPNLYHSISQQAKYYRSKHLHNTGTTKVIWAKRTLVANGVIVRACYDTKQAETVDAKGKSALPPKTPSRWLDEMRVEQLQGRWVVDGGRTTPVKC